jgi:hypothetical protein
MRIGGGATGRTLWSAITGLAITATAGRPWFSETKLARLTLACTRIWICVFIGGACGSR